MLRVSVTLVVPFAARVASGGVCKQAENNSPAWPFQIKQELWRTNKYTGHSFSCASSAGGTNDLGTFPHQCEGDPASVRIQTTPGKTECLVAAASECGINMHDFVSLDYEFAIDGCMGVWAAPLWITPDTWQWGSGSGEIDSMEFCPRDGLYLNFAGGGHHVGAPRFSLEKSEGHITVRKDEAGIVTISACTKQEALNTGTNQCPRPVYANCNDCMSQPGFACWCNPPLNIYGSGGCTSGTNCQWTMVSDIWNGVSGDAGYAGCMTAVPSINLAQGMPNTKSSCAVSVERITLRGVNGPLRWPEGTSKDCNVFTDSTLLMDVVV